ncbi:MAG: AAA domain-containing protein [Armatimonadota bacterium]
MPPAKPLVRATQIGEFIRHGGCERRFKLAFNDYELANALPFFFQLSTTIDPVLSEAGRRREREWEELVQSAGLVDLCRYEEREGEEKTPWDAFAALAAALPAGTSGYGREIEVRGEIGGFAVVGRIDFVLLLWTGDRFRLRLVECKASRRDRTYHRVQLVLYLLILRQLLAEQPLVIDGVPVAPQDLECVVARIDEATDTVHDVLALPPLDLSMEEADVLRLLAANGPLQRVLATELDALPFQLDSRCDDCALHVHCLAESARQRRVELLGVDPSTARTLRQARITSLDDVAELDLDSPAAARIRRDPGFSGNLATLVLKARARRRTLPGGDGDPEDLEVMPLPHSGSGQLPAHLLDSGRLVRVFVSISFDYVENRVGAVAAHVTRSDRPLSTLFRQDEQGRWRPDPAPREQWKEDGNPEWRERPVQGQEVVGVLPQAWSGDYGADTDRERDLLQRFFARLTQAIGSYCPSGEAPVHLYFWSRGEVTRLVEACSRCGGDLLGHLRELLGCRAPLEQLIYSVLKDEVEHRYALGWSGNGLVVASSLKWFGRRFHYTRRVGEEVVALDRIFAQDLFDFKTTLRFRGERPGQPWRPPDDTEADRHAFEVHACFEDALPAPYWRAAWGTLPDPEEPKVRVRLDPKIRAALRRYRQAGSRRLLRAYLASRVQALRWIEESIKFKNDGIQKPPLRVDRLANFQLGVNDTARAALDFLWLEQHVKVNDWLATHLLPPVTRVPEGKTVPLRNLRAVDDNVLEAQIDLSGYPFDRAALETRCSFAEGAFVRVSPCSDDPARGQTVKQLLLAGTTCVIERLDWEAGVVRLAVRPNRGSDRYLLRSGAWSTDRDPYPHATMDESPSDFVGGRVDARLQTGLGSHAYSWFDPTGAQLPAQEPLEAELALRYESLLRSWAGANCPLAEDQLRAALDGLGARVQLLQGPPGTGKTQSTAIAILLRVLARYRPGDVVLVTGNTHLAVDTLLSRVLALLPAWEAHVTAQGLTMPRLRVARVHSSFFGTPSTDDPVDLGADRCHVRVQELQDDGVLLLGGTPGALLKMAANLGKYLPWKQEPNRFQASLLVVDEASMLLFPHFLALTSLTRQDGQILLAGDHRQLAPIIGHDWENEDRPTAVLYQPHVSAYEAVQRLKLVQGLQDNQILRSGLRYTFRLPAPIRELLTRLYRRDGLELEGRTDPAGGGAPLPTSPWEALWNAEGGLFLVTHDERNSKQSNPMEAALIQEILAAGERLGRLEPGSVGIVMPHRSQRALLKHGLQQFDGAVDVLDTVERLQGGERETILVSATASDPTVIAARADFLLNLNRANVAFSRAKRRLIVVCAESLLTHIAPEVEHYEAAVLWKGLRSLCSEPVARVTLGEHRAELWRYPRGGPSGAGSG